MDIETSNMGSGSIFANRYRIGDLLGTGGMGKVFLADDLILNNEKVALKILHGEIGSNDALKQRFIREVQLTRKVTHPSVVRTFDVGVEQDKLYFTMEFVEGKTLKEKIAGEPLEPQEATRILIELCDGLSAIHGLDIVHRDLKSSNVILDNNGRVKITDFGVARPGNSELTQTDELLGSATHIAPESWKDGSGNQMTDIYTLGIIAYELLTGILPFDGKSPHELMFKHLKQKPVEPVEINPHVPRWLNSLVMRMLEKTPALRPPSAESIINEIKTRIRKSTVEDARTNMEALAAHPPSEAAPPLGYQEPEEVISYEEFQQQEEEEELDALRARSPTVELPPLERVSFTAQPAALEVSDGESPPIFPSPSKVSFAREVIPGLASIMRDVVSKGALAIIGGCLILYAAGQFPETWITASRKHQLLQPLAVSVSSLLLAALLLTLPFLPICSLKRLRQSDQQPLWKGFCGCCLLVGLILIPYIVRAIYWSAGLDWSDVPRLVKAVSIPTLVNSLELATLSHEGSQYRPAFFEDRIEIIPSAVWTLERQIAFSLAWVAYALLAAGILVRSVLSIERRSWVWQVAIAAFLLSCATFFTLVLREDALVGKQLIAFQFGFSEIKVSFAGILGAVSAWTVLLIVTISVAVMAEYRAWRKR